MSGSWWDTLKYDPLGGLSTAVSSVADTVASSETGAWLVEGASSVAGTVATTLEETADKATRATQRYLLDEEVVGLKKEIQLTKRRWGATSWEAMDAGDMVEVARNFEQAKQRVEELLAEIQDKTKMIAELDEAPGGASPGLDLAVANEAAAGDAAPADAVPLVVPDSGAKSAESAPQSDAPAMEVPSATETAAPPSSDSAAAISSLPLPLPVPPVASAEDPLSTEVPLTPVEDAPAAAPPAEAPATASAAAPPAAPSAAAAPSSEPAVVGVSGGNAADADADLEAELDAMLKD